MMASVDEFFDTVTAGSKDSSLCCVKFCRSRRGGPHRLCHAHRMAKWRAENPIKSQFNILRDSARKRRIEFSLTFEQFKSMCMSTNYHEQSGCEAHCLQVDRVDAVRGYSIDNIQIITTSENTAKGNRERKHREYQRALLKRKGLTDEQIDEIISAEEDDWVDSDSVQMSEHQSTDDLPF